MHENLVLAAAFRFQDANVDRDPVRAEDLHAFARDLFVRIQTADHDPRDLMLQDRFRTGRRAPIVAAGFQRDVQRRAARAFGAGFQGVAFGMQAAALLVPALADHAPALHQHRADERVWVDMTGPALR